MGLLLTNMWCMLLTITALARAAFLLQSWHRLPSPGGVSSTHYPSPCNRQLGFAAY